MANKIYLTVTSDQPEGTLEGFFSDSNPNAYLNKVSNYLSGIAGGSYASSFNVKFNDGNAVFANGTLTCTSVAANDTATIGIYALTAVDKRESTNITAGPDVAGSLNSTYFTFTSLSSTGASQNFYVWYNINSAGVDPLVPSSTGIAVAGATGASANTLATATRAALAAATNTIITGATSHIIITNTYPGNATDAADGAAPTGFGFSITQGSTPGASQFEIYATDTLTGDSLAALINSTTGLKSLVSATNASGVVTVTSLQGGVVSNNIPLAGTGGVAAGATFLASGAEDTSSTNYNFGR